MYLLAAAGWFAHVALGSILFLSSSFLILLVLVQRGRGGGLTGALGGMGGQSAFGTRAGDLFTRITVGAVLVWIAFCIVTFKVFGEPPPPPDPPRQGEIIPAETDETTEPGPDTSGDPNS